KRHATWIGVARGVVPSPDRRRKGSVALRALEAILAYVIAELLARLTPPCEIDAREFILSARADRLEVGEVASCALEPNVLEDPLRLLPHEDERRVSVGWICVEAV